MAIDFAALKANQATKTEKLKETLKQSNSDGGYQADTRFWNPTMDKEKGVGGAVIRFLPTQDDSTLEFVKYIEFAFKGPTNKWYIERCLSDIGLKTDPVAKFNARLWATGIKANKDACSKQRQNKRHVCNILVIKDTANPDNDGKTFLYRYGAKIAGFIDTKLNPVEDVLTGTTPDSVNAFDMWNGANFELRIKETDNGWNYDDSKFADKTSPVAKNDTLIESIFNQTISLAEFVAPSHYKTEDGLKKRLIEVLGTTYMGLEVVEGYGAQFPTSTARQESAPAQQESTTSSSMGTSTQASFESEEDKAMFDELMQDDVPF